MLDVTAPLQRLRVYFWNRGFGEKGSLKSVKAWLNVRIMRNRRPRKDQSSDFLSQEGHLTCRSTHSSSDAAADGVKTSVDLKICQRKAEAEM